MSQAPRLARAGVLTGLLAVIAVSCSSDIVELLPPLTAGASSGGVGGSAGQGTAASGSSSASGSGGRHAGGSAGSPTSQGGFAGAPQAGGGHGGAAGASGSCFGPGCAGESGFGGSFGGPNCGNGFPCTPCVNGECSSDLHCSPFLGCVQCTTKGPSQCWPDFNCDVLVGRCVQGCDSMFGCSDGRVCDLNQNACVWCVDNLDCGQHGDPRGICYFHRCVECTQNDDCITQGEGRRCLGTRCVQPCLMDKDCDDPGKHCDVPKGYCE